MVEIHNQDVITRVLSWMAHWLTHGGQDEYLIILRILAIQASILIGVSTLFKDDERNPYTLQLFALMYSIIGLIIPIELIIRLLPMWVQPPLFLISLILVFFLPGYLAFFLSPSPEKLSVIRRFITIVVIVLIVIS